MSEHKVREAARDERKKRLMEEFDKDESSVLLRIEIIFGAVATGEGRYGIQCGEYPGGLVKQASYDLLFRSMMMFQMIEFAKAAQAEQERIIVTPN